MKSAANAEINNSQVNGRVGTILLTVFTAVSALELVSLRSIYPRKSVQLHPPFHPSTGIPINEGETVYILWCHGNLKSTCHFPSV